MTLDFSSLLSGPENVFWFLLGVGSVFSWQWLKAKYRERHNPGGKRFVLRVNWLYIAVAFIILVTVSVAVQNQNTFTFAKQLAQDTRACQVEFNTALKQRGAITAENDRWSLVQRTALADLVHGLVFLPPDIADLSPENPRRVQYTMDIIAHADKIIREAQQEQDANISKRPSYPDPTCGN